MKRHFEQELDRLRGLLTNMAAVVEEMISESTEALVARDRQRASAVIPMEKRVNELELEVDETALKLLALRQPMAIDLRYITGAMKIATDLERMGDLGEKVAKLTVRLEKLPPADQPPGLSEMATLARSMARDCIASFVAQDSGKAAEVIWRDDEVDRLRHSIIEREKQAMASGEQDVEAGVGFILAARALERVADHATNIAEDVVYIVQGEVVKHGPRPEIEDDDSDAESE